MSTTSAPLPLPQLRAGSARAAHGGSCGTIRKSRRGKWRAAVLIGIHIAILAHILHWRYAGQTLTPLEPSEAMQTLNDGLVNAGFILFALAILSTAIFGRFFCGWACHIVALQDLCTWLLRKLGLRPKPFRSRVLIFVPLGAALYMFVWPSAVRWYYGQERPEWVLHVTTDSFWATFPGPYIAALTFVVCGFLIVYLLGNKGFCTYACPYGGFFGPADYVALGKIRVTDACEGCGHCTAACTSNVRVHEEVKTYGMVVNPGCMKCLDCVDVCPNHALYFGFGRPGVAAAARAPAPRRTYDYAWWEELLLVLFGALAFYGFRGLYDKVPFLLSLGLAVICAFLLVTGLRALRDRGVRIHNLQLRQAGRTTVAGWTYLAFCGLLLAFVSHAAYLNWHWWHGVYLKDKTERLYLQPGGADRPETMETARAAAAALETARALGWMTVPNLESRLGALYSFIGDLPKAEHHLREALRADPRHDGAYISLARLRLAEGNFDAALADLRTALQINPRNANAPGELVRAALALGRPQEGAEILRAALARKRDNAAAWVGLAQLLAQSGDRPAALDAVRKALQLNPRDAAATGALANLAFAGPRSDQEAACRELLAIHERYPQNIEAGTLAALLLAALGEPDRAIALFERIVAQRPDVIVVRVRYGLVLANAGRPADAAAQLDAARALDPYQPPVNLAWARYKQAAGQLDAEIARLESAPTGDSAAAYALVFAYGVRGDISAAERQYERAVRLRPGLPHP